MAEETGDPALAVSQRLFPSLAGMLDPARASYGRWLVAQGIDPLDLWTIKAAATRITTALERTRSEPDD